MSQDFHRDSSHADFIIRCQQLATPRIQALMRAEEDFLRALPEAAESLVDVGCGSGRILEALAGRTRRLAGIDLVTANLHYCHRRAAQALLVEGDALAMPFRNGAFAVAAAMINTLGNFGADQAALLAEMRRVGGTVVAGCYSRDAAPAQREWYAVLEAQGLLGGIDEARSDDFRCVTRDGYISERFDEPRLEDLFRAAGMAVQITRPIPELLLAAGKR